MKRILLFGFAAALAWAAEPPLYVFDNGVGFGSLSIEEQAELTKTAGYAGIFYTGTKDIPGVLAAHRSRGLKLLGIYTGTNLSKPDATYDPGLPEAIRQLRGTGALIAFIVEGKGGPGADEVAVAVIRQVADMAAESGLKVALYPHFGFYAARVEDALRLREKAGRKNVGIVFNLCHWLRSGDEANMVPRLKEALPHTLMVSVNGADHEGDWNRLIQTLDRGAFDVRGFLRTLQSTGYKGPFGLQCYNVKGDRKDNLDRSMRAWREINAR
jgi:sugar phosphate isomerase/epimerase